MWVLRNIPRQMQVEPTGLPNQKGLRDFGPRGEQMKAENPEPPQLLDMNPVLLGEEPKGYAELFQGNGVHEGFESEPSYGIPLFLELRQRTEVVLQAALRLLLDLGAEYGLPDPPFL